jgi:succinoglycan biosynthesis transport protein ExoP
MIEKKLEPQAGFLPQLQHYGRILLKWKWTALIFFILVIGGALLYAFLTKPVYTATGSLWIEDEPKILPFEEIQTLRAGNDLPSQTRLLQSRSLAIQAIETLRLYENSDFTGVATDGKKSFAEEDPAFRNAVIERFRKSIAITQAEGTRLVDIRFSSSHPKVAADSLNALCDGFIGMISRKRFSDSEQAMEFLNAQITSLRAEISDREKKLNDYGSQRNILPPTAAEAPTVSRLAEFNKALTDATIDRINKFNYYNQIKNAPLGEIPDAPNGTLIQSLRAQYSQLSREYIKRLATIRPEYPEMQRLKSELDAATEALQNETQNIVRIAYTDYQAAQQKEQSFQKQLNDIKNDAFRNNSNSIQYNSLRIELDSKKTLLEALAKKQSETDVSSRLKGLKAINVWIVDRADPPLRPALPNKRKILLFGFLIGLAGGCGLAFVLEALGQTIKTKKDIAINADLGTLGVIPSFGTGSKWKGSRTERSRFVAILRGGGAKFGGGKAHHRDAADKPSRGDSGETAAAVQEPEMRIELITVHEPQSIQAEGFRSVRTTLLVSSPPRKTSTIIITSALAREGKSAAVANLGYVLAKGGKRVVIVDSDLRKPKQHLIFSPDKGEGLTRFLNGAVEAGQVIKPTAYPNLSLIKCGPIPPNPIELLTSEKMEELVISMRQNFDYIIFDTPPCWRCPTPWPSPPWRTGPFSSPGAGRRRPPRSRRPKPSWTLTRSVAWGPFSTMST